MVQVAAPAFEVSISGRNDGSIEAVYIAFTATKVARTKEVNGDALLADFDSGGQLVGLEILAPVKLSELTKQVDPTLRKPFRHFLEHSLPSELLIVNPKSAASAQGRASKPPKR